MSKYFIVFSKSFLVNIPKYIVFEAVFEAVFKSGTCTYLI